jgi:hypothetical protein
MNKIALFFVCALGIFGTLGFLNGKKHAKDPDFLRGVLFTDVVMEHRPAEGERAAICHLVYRKGKGVTYRYDVESNSLWPSANAKRLEVPQDIRPGLTSFLDDNVLLTFLGGSTAGFTIKDLRSAKSKDKNGGKANIGSSATPPGRHCRWQD